MSNTMGKKVAISQSNYIPWRGYFDLINSVDEFILYDDRQYTRRDWRNRNLIVTPRGLQWLSIPVKVKGKYFQTIAETQVSEKNWAQIHWNTIKHHYKKAPYFKSYENYFHELYVHLETLEFLSEINFLCLKKICGLLNITTNISFSMEYNIDASDKTMRLIKLCQALEGNIYLSGPAAKIYMDESLMKQHNIILQYMSYDSYPEYPQLYNVKESKVSILDLIFNVGNNARKYMLT